MAEQAPARDAAVVVAYRQQTQVLRDRVAGLIERIWRALGEYRGPQQAQFVAQVVPLVLAAQRQMSSLTIGYHTAQRNLLLGRTLNFRVDPVKVTGKAARRGADPVDVYGRPFHLVWRQLAELPHEPGAIDQAIQAGLDRAVQTALTDLQLTKMQTSDTVAQQDKQVKWVQRVLEGPHSCALCIVASTQRYRPRATELKAIHPACDCSQRFVYGDEDPGQIVDLATLADVHDRVAQRFGSSSSAAQDIRGVRDDLGELVKYRDVLITHEHGELGPVLAVRGQTFTGPNDLGD